MASVPQFYSDLAFSGDNSSQFANPLTGLETYSTVPPEAAISSNCSILFDDYGGFDIFQAETPKCNADVSLAPVTFFPENLGVSDSVMAAALWPEHNNNIINITGACGNDSGIQYCYGGHEFAEECSGFSPEFKPVINPVAGDQNWGVQGGKPMEPAEDNNAKVGKYSVEERKDRILRYLKKKNQRNFNKTIKYVCRKTLADRRVRIRGRFARNNELCEQETTLTKKNSSTKKEDEMYSGDDLVQIEQDDGWLQEAMSSLMYYPYDSYINPGDQKTWSL